MKIILIGFMGSGKSSVAKKLGPLLKWPILEMDELVLQKTDTKNMPEVFAKGGELLLRETEIAIAKGFASTDDTVISTGAGVVLNKIVLDYFKTPNGKVFFFLIISIVGITLSVLSAVKDEVIMIIIINFFYFK